MLLRGALRTENLVPGTPDHAEFPSAWSENAPRSDLPDPPLEPGGEDGGDEGEDKMVEEGESG
jgi:hypothetical protein